MIYHSLALVEISKLNVKGFNFKFYHLSKAMHVLIYWIEEDQDVQQVSAHQSLKARTKGQKLTVEERKDTQSNS